MKIVIDVADLDCERIDGTRVYIQNVLKHLGKLSPEDEFFLFHKSEYNKLLKPAKFANYYDRSLGKGFWWTQFKFARAVKRLKPSACWMPIQQIPFLPFGRSKKTKYVVTIHDLAFKFFPKHFPLIDKLKINFYTNIAVRRADKIIAISESTKQDLIRLYPEIDERKIEVVYHGFDRSNFQQKFNEGERAEFLKKWKLGKQDARYKIQDTNKFQDVRYNFQTNSKKQDIKYKQQYLGSEQVEYLLYVGAIQPRKDLVTLIRAFEKIKQDVNKLQDTRYKAQLPTNKSQITRYKTQAKYNNEVRPFPSARSSLTSSSRPNLSSLKLVLVGEVAWKSESTIEAIGKSEFKEDIILTGRVDFKELAMFYRLAKIFVFPSLYEGFGIPLLEAMANETPVITADNSSLGEVGGDAVLKFESGNVGELTEQIKKLLNNKKLQQEMVQKGLKRIEKFSWKECARKTVEVLKNVE
jgi:glycosyltransferase involved in cell wall biosynthesis